MRTEEDLIRTLRTAAGHADPDSALASAVAARRRSRRRAQRIRTALAAAAVVLVAGGTTAVLSQGREPQPAVTVMEGIRPAAEVWPEAVFTIPGEAADGREYRPMGALSATEVLVGALAPDGAPDRLEAFDTRTRTFRTIGVMPKPKEPSYRFRDVQVGKQHIAWWGQTNYNGEGAWADFWYVPRSGGETEHVAKVTGELSQVDGFDISGDHLVFSVKRGGVYRLPLTGGEPEKIDGTDGLHLVSWPLAAAYTPGNRSARTQKRTVNLETGRSVDVSLPRDTLGFVCGSRWCAGTRTTDGSFRQRVDGSDRRPLPGELRPFAFPGLLADRFVFGRMSSGKFATAVYDLDTGQFAGLSPFDADFGFGTPLPTVFHWGDRRERTVVNLLAVR